MTIMQREQEEREAWEIARFSPGGISSGGARPSSAPAQPYQFKQAAAFVVPSPSRSAHSGAQSPPRRPKSATMGRSGKFQRSRKGGAKYTPVRPSSAPRLLDGDGLLEKPFSRNFLQGVEDASVKEHRR